MKVKVIEKSPLARIARMVLMEKAVAMVLGNGIHLSGVTKEEFLNDKKWVKHELVHVEQYKRYGILKFLTLYLIESIRNGYFNNKFEVEAREKSKN